MLKGLSQHCTSNDPLQDPAFDPNYFEDDIGTSSVKTPTALNLSRVVDLQLLVEVLKFGRKIGQTAPLKDLIGELYAPRQLKAADPPFSF